MLQLEFQEKIRIRETIKKTAYACNILGKLGKNDKEQGAENETKLKKR
jgi:hypothetical protein